MARRVYIQDNDLFAGGNRAALAVLGATEHKSVLGLMDHDRLEDVKRITASDEQGSNIPKEVDGRVGLQNIKNYKGRKVKLLGKMPWASIAVLTPVGGFQRVDLTSELRWLMQALIAAASPFTRSGRYRSSFRYVVGKSVQRGIPRGDEWTLAGVTNIAPYASAIENMRSKMTFRRVFTKVQARAKSNNYDARMFYLLGKSEDGGKYPSPIIQIGQLNSMRGRTGLQFKKRPQSRRRRWPR